MAVHVVVAGGGTAGHVEPAMNLADALVAARASGLNWQIVTLEVDGVTMAVGDARGSEPIYRNGTLVGRATNGGYGWRCQKSLALAMVRPEQAAVGTELEIKILGKIHAAKVIPESPWEPENVRLRG